MNKEIRAKVKIKTSKDGKHCAERCRFRTETVLSYARCTLFSKNWRDRLETTSFHGKSIRHILCVRSEKQGTK